MRCLTPPGQYSCALPRPTALQTAIPTHQTNTQDRPRNELEEVIEGVQNTALPDVNVTEIKSAVLGLLRRHKLELTDDFALQRPR